MIRKWIGLVAITLVPFAAMAQDEETRGLGYRLLEGVLPIIVLFAILWLFLRFTMKKSRSYQQRAVEHMDRIEQKYDRIIELLTRLIEKDK